MAYLRALVTCYLVSFCACSYAGYAQLSPPPGWSPGGTQGSLGTFNFGNSANTARLVDGTVRTNASLSVGGRSVAIPASMRFATNAPRIAAAAIYLHPGLRTAASIAGWLLASKLVYDVSTGIWRETADNDGADGYLYRASSDPNAQTWYPSATAACNSEGARRSTSTTIYSLERVDIRNGIAYQCVMKVHNNNNNSDTISALTLENKKGVMPGECPSGWSQTSAGCLSPAVDKPTFEDRLSAKPMPSSAPLDIPYPLPVGLPEIQPTFIPTGNPVSNPNYDPSSTPGTENQPYNQPGVRLNPAPNPVNPWQVDLQPVDRPVSKPDPSPEPKPDSAVDSGDKPRPDEQPGLCDMYPDIVACKKLGNLEPINFPKSTVEFKIEKQDIGPENGTCPAPREFVVMGKQMAFQWDLFCDFANGIRPLLIGFAWLSAALAFMGLTRRGD